MKPPDTHNRPLTEEEINQADIEAWTIIRNDAWNMFLTSVTRLALLGVRQNLCGFIDRLDKLRKNLYT